MTFPENISKNLRLLLTAITLLLVVGLNNREVTTYAVPEIAAGHQLVKSPAAEQHGTVKKKVSLEATSSYLVLQLVALPASFPRFNFSRGFIPAINNHYQALATAGFFKLLFAAAIQPNAP